jgi:CheY-like chemotaxis protein
MSTWPVGASCKNVNPRRVLVVEDESLIALFIAEQLSKLGHIVVGPAFSLSEARRFSAESLIDLCLLDLNLRGEFAGEVADTLARREIPYLIITGYDPIDRRYPNIEVLSKPIDTLELQRAIARTMWLADARPKKAMPVKAQDAKLRPGRSVN